MAVGGVKDPPFAIRPRPGVRFLFSIGSARAAFGGIGKVFELVGLYFAHGQHIVIRLQMAVQISFVVGFKRGQTHRQGIVWLREPGLNGVHFVPPKLPAHHFIDVFCRVSEAVRRAMHRNQPLPRLHKRQQRLFLRPGNTIPVGENQQAVVLRQIIGVDVREFVGVRDVDALVA